MSGVQRCAKQVFNSYSFRGKSCSRIGCIERNGKWWCAQHDPERVAARQAALHAKWEAERAAQDQVKVSAEQLAKTLGIGLPEYSRINGGYTGRIVLTAEEAKRVIGWLEALRAQ